MLPQHLRCICELVQLKEWDTAVAGRRAGRPARHVIRIQPVVTVVEEQ